MFRVGTSQFQFATPGPETSASIQSALAESGVEKSLMFNSYSLAGASSWVALARFRPVCAGRAALPYFPFTIRGFRPTSGLLVLN
jgi:hypothetical protein